MYSAALEAIILVGNLKVLIIALGWVGGLAMVAAWIGTIVVYSNEYNKYHTAKKVWPIIGVFMTLMMVASITTYNLPVLREDIVIARHVAPILDDFVDRNPETIYNPDVLLQATNDAILGIVNFSKELPAYIARLAAGGIPAMIQPVRKPEDMSRDELLQRVRELENR